MKINDKNYKALQKILMKHDNWTLFSQDCLRLESSEPTVIGMLKKSEHGFNFIILRETSEISSFVVSKVLDYHICVDNPLFIHCELLFTEIRENEIPKLLSLFS